MPRNAAVYASGQVTVPRVVRTRVLPNLLAIVVLTLMTHLRVGVVFT